MNKTNLAIVASADAGPAFQQAVLPQAVSKAVLSLVPKEEIPAVPEKSPAARKAPALEMSPLQQQPSRYRSLDEESIAIRQQQESGRGDLWASYHFHF